MSQLFASGGQSIGVSASASVLPVNIQDWFPLGLTGLIYKDKTFKIIFIVLLLFSHPVMSDSLRPHGLQHTWPHQLPKFAQVHVHCISDAIQPSHPLTPFFPSALNLSKNQGLFQ